MKMDSYTMKYMLRGREVVATDDLEEWAEWYEKNFLDRHVEDTRDGDVRVSTVFLALDHRFSGEGPPILFETMVFGGEHDGEQWRYCTYDEAEEGHALACKLVFGESWKPILEAEFIHA